MYQKLVRQEVMNTLGKDVKNFIDNFINPVEKIRQSSDFLPNSYISDFKYEIDELQTFARKMDYDLCVNLKIEYITEETLPSYESWLMNVDGIEHIGDLNEMAQKAQEYLMKLPDRLQRITDRIQTPNLQYQLNG